MPRRSERLRKKAASRAPSTVTSPKFTQIYTKPARHVPDEEPDTKPGQNQPPAEGKEADLDEGGVMRAHIKSIMDTPGPVYLPKQMIYSKPAQTPAPIRGFGRTDRTDDKPDLSETYAQLLEEAVGAEKQMLCPLGHPMVEMTGLPRGYEFNVECDKCKWNIAKEKEFYHCTSCEYDICHTCKKLKDEIDDLPATLPASFASQTDERGDSGATEESPCHSPTALYILSILIIILLVSSLFIFIFVVLVFPDELKQRYKLCSFHLCKLSSHYRAAPVNTTWLDKLKSTVQTKTHPLAHKLHQTLSPLVNNIVEKWESLPTMTESSSSRVEL